ncbi:MAG: hypothetical protein SFW62_02070 [Alphaproteobacteria bacterium]|nr:hypothetical protein [Alphaproteobacteria bacterium]
MSNALQNWKTAVKEVFNSPKGGIECLYAGGVYAGVTAAALLAIDAVGGVFVPGYVADVSLKLGFACAALKLLENISWQASAIDRAGCLRRRSRENNTALKL